MLIPAAFSFGDALVTVIEIAFFFAWLCLLFYIYADIFRSHDLSGGAKALWILAIFIFPLLGSLVYLIFRGAEMHERAALAARAGRGTSVDELERLSALHRQGSLSDDEFERAKHHLLPPWGGSASSS
jgi:hypothetical protein